MKVKRESEVAQSCPTLSDTLDRSLPGSSIHGIFQARVLEWDFRCWGYLKIAGDTLKIAKASEAHLKASNVDSSTHLNLGKD